MYGGIFSVILVILSERSGRRILGICAEFMEILRRFAPQNDRTMPRNDRVILMSVFTAGLFYHSLLNFNINNIKYQILFKIGNNNLLAIIVVCGKMVGSL